MKIRWRALIVLFLVGFAITHLQSQVNAQTPEGEDTVNHLYIPTVMVSLKEPEQEGTGEGQWYQGKKMHVEWYDFQPHYTLEIGVPVEDGYICKDIVMWNVIQRKYITVDDGHWRFYPENPEIWGPHFWQITKSWIASHILEALRPSYYWAWCTPK